MSKMHRVLTGMSCIALAAAFATPGFAAKSVIADEEMDQVTAAGEPKIAMVKKAIAAEDVYSFNEQLNWFSGTLEEGSQNELKAITLNNIFGENQVANGVNIQSSAGTTDGSSQDNDILQSWGSAKASPGKAVDGVASSGNNTSTVAQALANNQNQNMDAAKIVASDQNLENTQSNAAQVQQQQNHAAAAGKLSVLWAFADEIASVEGAAAGGSVYATNYVDTSIIGVVEGGAQSNISALTVNNVFGLNQVANALNVAAGDMGFDPLSITSATAASATSQLNKIQQYRGAPAGWTDAPVFH